MTKIGVYIGTQSDSVDNIAPVLKSWETALVDTDIEIELYGSSKFNSPSKCKYVKQENRSDHLPHKILRGYQYTQDYIHSYDPDVVMQIWKYATHAPGVALAGMRFGVPTVGRFTGDTFNEYQGFSLPKQAGIFGLNNINGRVPLYLFDKMITLGPYGQSELSSRGVAEEDLFIIPPPAPPKEQFFKSESTDEYRDDLDIPHEKTVFLYVGRLTSQKGMKFLRDTISRLPSSEDYLFLLIGTGRYQSIFNEDFNNDTARAIGRVPYNQIDRYYKLADCYIHPSPYEGLPLVILEALSCGTPVLSRPAGDIPFVTDNLAETPAEMASMILNDKYVYNWKNRDMFLEDKQQELLMNLFSSIG